MKVFISSLAPPLHYRRNHVGIFNVKIYTRHSDKCNSLESFWWV